MEKHNMLALSTGHVSRETAELMDDDNIDDVTLYNKSGYGWYVYIPDEGIDFDKLADGECPADLYRCMKYARDNGCDWLMFDCDVETIDELPVYNW